MNHGLILPIVIPLCAAGAIVALPLRARRLQRLINVVATLALVPVAVWLAARAATGGIATYALGACPRRSASSSKATGSARSCSC